MYLRETGLDLDDPYRNGRTWTELQRAAGLAMPPPLDGETEVGRGIGRLLHVDNPKRLDRYKRLLSHEVAPHAASLDKLDRRALQAS